MPDWEIELPDGRVVTITSDQPPTKADVLAQVQGDGSTGWGQTLSNFGVPETVGGLAGGAMAGLPGAMAGAAFGRVLRGGIAGEDPASVGGGALGAAALEGAIPGLG